MNGRFRPILLCNPVVSTGPCKEATGVAFLQPQVQEMDLRVQGPALQCRGCTSASPRQSWTGPRPLSPSC